MSPVSMIVPVRNGAACLRDTLESIWAQDAGELELIVVDDGSTDESVEVITAIARGRALRLLAGEGRGAAAALNLGLRAATHPIVCQVDQDVVLTSGWMKTLLQHFAAENVAAVQGMYITDPRTGLLARVMSRDLEERYAALPAETDHVCTGNVAYRADALRRIGGFDETLGYGYDNDLSYRLRAAGYRLLFCPAATSTHRWREGLAGYLRQQYGFGYGRLDLLAKHPHRVGGDAVSPWLMMFHPVFLLLAILLFAIGAIAPLWRAPAWSVGGVLLALLVLERSAAGFRAARRFRDCTALWFPLVHLLRDLAWVAAIGTWVGRRAVGKTGAPVHSMRPRQAVAAPRRPAGSARPLIVIPAFNEALNLREVVGDIRAHHPAMDILVVDDGSTDGTECVVNGLGVRWVRLPQQMGIGAAMRVGLRYAVRQQFDVVVRLDGDGQHRAEDIGRLLHPVLTGRADVVLGNRATGTSGWRDRLAAPLKRPLALGLSLLTNRRVSDPTCGLCAVGPRAIHLLAEQHPTGYPEPELRLFLSRTDLATLDVTVLSRPRLHGKTSLTPLRMLRAAARVAIAMCVVPFRRIETESSRD